MPKRDPNDMIQYASNELHIAGMLNSSDKEMNKLGQRIMSLVSQIKGQNHPPGTDSIFRMLNVLARVTRGLPISPLMGVPSEWGMVTANPYLPEHTLQNLRFFSLFKNPKTGEVLHRGGYEVIEGDGSKTYEDKRVSFPYIPTWERITREQFIDIQKAISDSSSNSEIIPVSKDSGELRPLPTHDPDSGGIGLPTP